MRLTPSSLAEGRFGLFAVFELGLLDIKAHVVDILDRPGRPMRRALSREADLRYSRHAVVTGQELTDRLMEQIKPFGPSFISARWSRLWSGSTSAFRLTTDIGDRARMQGAW